MVYEVDVADLVRDRMIGNSISMKWKMWLVNVGGLSPGKIKFFLITEYISHSLLGLVPILVPPLPPSSLPRVSESPSSHRTNK